MSGAAEKRPPRQESLPIRDWFTGTADRSGLSAFTHLIRAKGDPEERKARGGAKSDKTPHKTLERTPVETWRKQLLDLLVDGEPRTFNRICVEVVDGHTADVCFQENPNRALWQLVDEGLVEHTTDAPILFRRKTVP